MQAIVTKYIGPTNTKGARIKATCDASSITIGYPAELSGEAVHAAAAMELVRKLGWDDHEKYGDWVCASVGNGDIAYVFVSTEGTVFHGKQFV